MLVDFTSIQLLIKQRRKSTLVTQKKLCSVFNKCFPFLCVAGTLLRGSTGTLLSSGSFVVVRLLLLFYFFHTEMPYKYLGV